jgi:hypothetical protein
MVMVMVLLWMRLRYPNRYPDSFAAYDGIMPGQPLMASTQLSCHSQTVGIVNNITYCQITSLDERVRSATMTVRGGRVSDVWFSVKGVTIGDLVYHWGLPKRIRRDEHFLYLTWRHGLHAIVDPETPVRQFDFKLLIKALTLTNETPLS